MFQRIPRNVGEDSGECSKGFLGMFEKIGNRMRGTRGMFTRIPENLLEDSGECYYFNIPGNVPEDSGEC